MLPSHRETYEVLLSQLYDLPVNQKRYPMNFIGFDDAGMINQQKQIERFEINPTLQVWAGKNNRIITLYAKNGSVYLVKAVFNPLTNQIFPPIT
jgi:hypothetical protein